MKSFEQTTTHSESGKLDLVATLIDHSTLVEQDNKEKLDSTEEIKAWESLGNRGLTALLLFFRRYSAGQELAALKEQLQGTSSLDAAQLFSQWCKDAAVVATALHTLAVLSQATIHFDGEALSEDEIRAEKLKMASERWKKSLPFLINNLNDEEKAVFFSKSILEELPYEYRVHLLRLFHHNLAGGRLLGSLTSALDNMIDMKEDAEMVRICLGIVNRYLDTWSSVLAPYTFDREKPHFLTIEEFIQVCNSIFDESSTSFPGLEIQLDLESLNQFTATMLDRILPLSETDLRNIIDNALANAQKAPSNETTMKNDQKRVVIRLLGKMIEKRELGKISYENKVCLLIEDNGAGFSKQFNYKGDEKVTPTITLQPIKIEGKSINLPGITGTGQGLKELEALIQLQDGNFYAGNLYSSATETKELLGGAILVELPVI